MILERLKLYSQIRYDLEYFDQMQSGVRTDWNYFINSFFSGTNHIVKGFSVTGIGLKAATIAATGATLIIPESTTDFSWFTSQTGASDIVLADADLTDNTRNYVELSMATLDGTPVTAAFWDSSANDGDGAEFNQTVNSATSIVVTSNVRTGGFSGDPDKIPICYIDTDASGNITIINDQRELFFRLGTVASPTNDFSWGTQEEPILTVVLTGGSGSYVAGDTVTFSSGATATVVTGGTTNITIKLLSSDSFAAGDTLVVGATNRTVVSVAHSFTGGDSDIDTFKEMFDALMTEIKAIKGTSFWYQSVGASISGAIKFINSIITQNTTSARFEWSAGNLNITDDNGAPADADVIGLIRLFGSSQVLSMTRQDGTGGSTQIAIADGEVLYVTLPTTGNQTYTGSGAAATNYKVAAFASFTVNDFNYWLAFREGNKLFVRGIGELESGESVQIGDLISEEFIAYTGATDETDSTPAYSTAKVVTQGSDLTTAIGALDEEVSDYRFKTVPNPGGADKTVRIYPSKETDAAGKTIYTFIDPTFSSKFPRVSYSTGAYDGGVSNDQLVTLAFSDPAAGTVTVTATGPTFGAQVVGTFSTVGGGSNFTPVSIFAASNDTLALVAGSNYATQALAEADDALPLGLSSQFKICTIINEVDAGNTTTQNISSSDILDRRDFEHITTASSLGTLEEVSSANKTIVAGDGIRVVSFSTGASNRTCNLSAANSDTDRLLEINKTDSGSGYVVVTPNGGDTIEGLSSYTLYFQGDTIRVISDGVSDWKILKYSSILIQDFVALGDIGDSNQTYAGHQPTLTEVNTLLTDGSVLAMYLHASGSMTTDETGNYGLTDPGGVNSPTNTTGILNTNFGAYYDGGDYYTITGPASVSLFETPSTLSKGIAGCFWLKLDDGIDGSNNIIMAKINDETGGTLDGFYIEQGSDGRLTFQYAANSASYSGLVHNYFFPNGVTPWYFVWFNWDTTNGLRFGVFNEVVSDPTNTTLMSDGTARDFILGATNNGGSVVGNTTGKIVNPIFMDAIFSPIDIQMLMAVTIPEPSILTGKNYKINHKVNPDGNSNYETQGKTDIITKYNGNIYLPARQFGQTDELRLIGEIE